MPRHAAWLLAAVALAGPGCASLSASRARAARERTELQRFRYTQPLDVVWPAVQRLLADRGLGLAGTDADAVGQKHGALSRFSSVARETRSTPTGGLVLDTAWDQNMVRWRAEAEPDAGGLRVVLTRVEMSRDEFGIDGVSLRDYQLELDLLRRVDLEAAARIEDPEARPAPVAAPSAPPPATAPSTPPPPASTRPGPPGP